MGKVKLQQLASDVTSIINDNKYGIATGTANTYAVTLGNAPTALTEGMLVSVKINIDSTGASTLNVNGLGAQPIKKANGTNVTNLKANGIYTLRYGGTSFILQGEGGSGNALASDLLTGKTATTDAGDITGTMVDRGALTITPSTINQAISVGFHNGSGTVVGDADLIAGNIKQGVGIFGIVGSLEPLPASLTAGANLLTESSIEKLTSSTSYVKQKEIQLLVAGTVRTSFAIRTGGSGSYSVFGQIYVNGVARGTLRSTTSVSYVTFTEDITVNKNDLIQVWVSVNNAIETGYVKEFKILTVEQLITKVLL